MSDLKRFEFFDIVDVKNIAILSTKHAEHYASAISDLLTASGFNTQIFFKKIEPNIDFDLYFVLSPNALEEVPPGHKTIAFQLEQLQNDRWVTSQYIEYLRSCLCVVEYAKENIPILKSFEIAYPKLFYVPIGTHKRSSFQFSESRPKKERFLFYGEINSRRKRILDEISKTFEIRIEENLFGDELLAAIKESKGVINIHYYENARLEYLRINQALSHGVSVISESTFTINNLSEHLMPGVYFFKENSITSLIDTLKHFDSLPEEVRSKSVSEGSEKQFSDFENYFYRMLLGIGLLDHEEKYLNFDLNPINSPICISMPETPERLSEKIIEQNATVKLFSGLRHSTPWIGCALSYRFIARQALSKGLETMEIFEDDVFLDEDFWEWRGKTLLPFLEQSDDWDVYCGMIAHFDEEAKILAHETLLGTQFVTVNQMTSMVYNIYNKRAISHLTNWTLNEGAIHSESIDRYMNKLPNLKVVTTLPFKVGHDSNPTSTLWQFANSEYDSVIKNSEILLSKKFQSFLRKKNEF